MAERPAVDLAVAAQIEAVLAEEQRALAEVTAARVDAEQIVAAGRTRARAILARGEQRLTAVRARMERRVAARVAALEAKAQQLQGPVVLDAATGARLARAVARLAAELTGGER